MADPTQQSSAGEQETLVSQYPRAYVVEERVDGDYFTPAFPKQNMETRMKMVMAGIPIVLPILRLPRKWTAEEHEQAGFRDLTGKTAYMFTGMGAKQKSWTLARHITPQQMQDDGHIQDMVELQQYFLDEENQKEFLAVQHHPKQYMAERGSQYDLALTSSPGHTGVFMSQIAKHIAGNVAMIAKIEKIATAVLRKYIPEMSASQQYRSWARGPAITFGHDENNYLTHIQVNLSATGQNLDEAIKDKGKIHTDRNDVPTCHSVVLFLDRHPPGYYNGKFFLYSIRGYCEAATYGAWLFSAKHPHSARGQGYYAPDTPEHLKYIYPSTFTMPIFPAGTPFGRVVVVGYPRNDAFYPQTKWLKALFGPESIQYLGTMRNKQEVLLRLNIKNRAEDDEADTEEWVERYAWVDETGVKQHPNLGLAELCLEEDGEEDALLREFHQLTLKTACGPWVPDLDNLSAPRTRAPRRKVGVAKIVPVKIICSGKTARGRPCKQRLLNTRRPEPYCKTHLRQAPQTQAVVDDGQDGGSVHDAIPAQLLDVGGVMEQGAMVEEY